MANNQSPQKSSVSTFSQLRQWFRAKIYQTQYPSTFVTVQDSPAFRNNANLKNVKADSSYLSSSDFKKQNSDSHLYEDGLLTLLRKVGKGTFNFVNHPKEGPFQPYTPQLAETELQERSTTAAEKNKSSHLWQETEKLLKVGSWEYETETKRFFCTDNTFNLLTVPKETKVENFLSFLPFFSKDDREGLKECWNNSLLFGEETEVISRLNHTSDAVWIKLKFKPINEGSRQVRIVGTLEDVTDQIAKERKLIFEKKKAEELAQAKAGVMSMFSHEIRTPLNSVMGLTYLLLQDGNVPAEHKKHLDSIHFSAQNLLSLCNNTLDYSKIESGRLELEEVNFKLKDLLDKIHQSFYTRAIEKKIDFNLVVDASIPEEVTGDPTRLTQVLCNLISNAIKFTNEGSVKLIVDVVYQSDNDCVLNFSVEDTGIGIPEESQQLVFESYVQANSSTHRKFGGTGLGLAITKKIVELHKGDIKLTSSHGEGSVFSVRLKYAKVKPSLSANCADSETNSNLEGLRVLVIDDDAMNNLILSELLVKWCATVDTAENGLMALEKISSNDYDLVLMDLYMPTMDGFETITQIREAGFQMPVIALTGTANEDEVHKLMAMGVNDYLIKPFHPQQLYDKLVQVSVEPSL